MSRNAMKDLLDELGMKQTEFSKLTGINVSRINMYANLRAKEISECDLKRLERIGIDVEKLATEYKINYEDDYKQLMKKYKGKKETHAIEEEVNLND